MINIASVDTSIGKVSLNFECKFECYECRYQAKPGQKSCVLNINDDLESIIKEIKEKLTERHNEIVMEKIVKRV